MRGSSVTMANIKRRGPVIASQIRMLTIMATDEKDAASNMGKVLIVYYSYSGNTREIAQEIHKMAGGDRFEIQPLESYPSQYNVLVEQAKRELHSGYRPKLKARVDAIGAYDTVFVGSPNWWYTIAPPVMSFLSDVDLSGKTIIPFVTHGGGGLGRSSSDIAGLCPNSTVLEGLSVYGADVKAAQKWLSDHWPIKR